MRDLSAGERFEEAALGRDRLRALAEALLHARTDGWLLGASELVLRDAAGRTMRLHRGALTHPAAGEAEPLPSPCPRDRADELAAVRSWLARNRVALVETDHPPAEPVDGGAHLHHLLAALRGADRREGSGPSARAS